MPTYSFMSVSASFYSFAGTTELANGAYSAEEGIEIIAKDPKNIILYGINGDVMNVLSPKMSCTVTVNLLKVSPINAFLNTVYGIQKLHQIVWGGNIIVISNNLSGDTTILTQVAFQKTPDLRYKKDGDIVQWVFDSGSMSVNLGEY